MVEAIFLTSKICGSFLENTNITFGPEKLFYVCRVCIQHYSLKKFGNNTMKLSVIEEKLYSKYFFNRLRFQNLPSDPKSYRAFGETGPWIVTRKSSVWNFCSRSSEVISWETKGGVAKSGCFSGDNIRE